MTRKRGRRKGDRRKHGRRKHGRRKVVGSVVVESVAAVPQVAKASTQRATNVNDEYRRGGEEESQGSQ